MIKILLKKKVDVNCVNIDGTIAITTAIILDWVDIVDLMLQAGA